ncbi:lysophospholipid acyltransferase LPEAT2-like [Tripterygium wilfordii]|uniref:Lysophospholipid acyltransferase LPEAT2-like n=1 Tax=Tripterygium wilfordii TaxID=458696 RepID=A0A7J7CBY2_TRIWF|nr:lysophospholipid acyltransferase LPEAT2-like [Tripterygium wilfordii]KAF5731684.1 lysophospholipid acyltransferase LPEAT2-like [Tripterygium wilfordii]
MAKPDLTSPLISSQPSDPPHVIVTVHDGKSVHYREQQSRNGIHYSNQNHQSYNETRCSRNLRDPFEFLGSGGLEVPAPTTVDPFRNHTHAIDGVYEMIKIVVCLPIAAARLVLFGLCLALGYIATKLALQGWKDRQNPMPRWRCRLMWITRVCTRCILFSFGYQWIRRKGKPAPREIAPIVVSNHVSYIDPIFYFYELFPTIVASESHDSLPFVGTIIRAMQVIYVDRFSPQSRKHAVNEIKRKAACDTFPRVLLFPEGTTSNGKALLSFQLGAFIPGYPVQPIVVRYPHVHFDQSWGDISLARLMFRMFTQFHNFMEVEYLPVVFPLENQKENVARFAERTSRAMATALNVVQTFYSYGDVLLRTEASLSEQDKPANYMAEIARVESLFHIGSMEALEFLNRFLSMNPDCSGRVVYHNFLKALRLRDCTLSEEVFGFINVDKNGSITFKQFLYASGHVMKQPLFRQACELAFAECDVAGNDCISAKELGASLKLAIPNLNNHEIEELFNLFDMDGDGSVSRDDFNTCLRKNPLLIALFSASLLSGNSSRTDDNVLEEIE